MKGHIVTEISKAPAPTVSLPPSVVMLQMLSGFQVSQALYVAAKLDIATILAAKGPQTIGQLAAEVHANADALGRVIRFLASVGVFRTDGEQVAVTELGTALAEGPLSLKYPAIYWMETHYAPFGDFLGTVVTGEPAGDEPHPAKVIDLVMLTLASGRERTEAAFRPLLDSAGFTVDRIVPSPTPYSFIEATLR